MKLSDKQTAYLLVRANTNSEWDNCDFAIIHITEGWKKELQKRIEFLTPLQGNYYFQSMNFYDTAADFYRADENDQPDIDELLRGKEWAFVELDEDKQERLMPPENRLDCFRIVLRANGTGYYTAYGKHTSEEFWTGDILLSQIIEQI